VGSALWLGRYLNRTTQTQKKRGQTFMSQMGFEPTISVLAGMKMFHALDRVAIVIG
jgi:hypothetical protein